jgi:ketosteroid isomerase-like protein
MLARDVVTRFNACINARDADGLAELMTDDHVFIDSTDSAVRGKSECLDAWRGFFASFPDYRNTFEAMRSTADQVFVRGYSTCSNAQLDGPALWSARVSADQVAEWRVYEDSPANRARLGLEID